MATPAQPTPKYSKDELLQKLRSDAETWNNWSQTLTYEDRRQIDLSDCDLTGFTLRGKRLWDINFKNTVLFGTDLHEADLRGAKLSEAKGCLVAKQFAGTNLTGATLPSAIATVHDKLGSVNEISDSAKKLFLALLAACLYSWLTIATTKDVDLITNRASSPLPIIQTPIPIVGFYIVAPLILLCIYFYLHFYLQKLWEELAALPAVFTDGRPLYVQGDPWLFNDLVRAHFALLRKDRPFLSHLQQWISILLAWWLVPFTLFWFWARYLRRHDILWTYIHAALLAISIAFAIQLYRLARETLRGQPPLPLNWQRFRLRQTYIDLLRPPLFAVILILMSSTAINSTPNDRLARMLAWARNSPFANLQDADVSIKPPNWSGKNDQELDQIKGADLRGRDLRYASGAGVFAVRTDLSDSDLRGANLRFADLRQATLSTTAIQTFVPINRPASAPLIANLDNADLSGALLNGANLQFTSMVRANLDHADLTGAILDSADLRDANLQGANLSGASLTLANLAGAIKPWRGTANPELLQVDVIANVYLATKIRYAHLEAALGIDLNGIKQCRDWKLAFYNDFALDELELPRDHNDAVEAYRKSGSQEPFDDAWIQKWRENKAKAESKSK